MTEKEGNCRVVVLQSDAQVKHYSKFNYRNNDVLIPIGPEAMAYADMSGLKSFRLHQLIDDDEYEQARHESQGRIDALVERLNDYSRSLNPVLGLEIGHYYAFQLWIIIGQVHHNYYFARAIANRFRGHSILIYKKMNCSLFLNYRPDPDCIFSDILINSGVIPKELLEIWEMAEEGEAPAFREKLMNILPVSLLGRLRYLRDKWRIRNKGMPGHSLLLIGGGYDWAKIARKRSFAELFSMDIIPAPVFSKRVKLDANLFGIIRDSVKEDGRDIFEVGNITRSISNDLDLFRAKFKKIQKQLAKKDAVVTAALPYPWDNYLAHIAVKSSIPVVVWQHGEKGQYDDVPSLYTELYYSTDYLAFGIGVKRLYDKWLHKYCLEKVNAVGSLGKNIKWKGGSSIVYATGKWFKTAAPFAHYPDPDSRQYHAHKTILGYLDKIAQDHKIIFKANNTRGLNSIPYRYENIHIDFDSPFTTLLETAGIVILDAPSTTLVEACSTQVPIFVLGGRARYLGEFIKKIGQRVVWCESPEELVSKLDNFLTTGAYIADMKNTEYRDEFCASQGVDEVVLNVIASLKETIDRGKMESTEYRSH